MDASWNWKGIQICKISVPFLSERRLFEWKRNHSFFIIGDASRNWKGIQIGKIPVPFLAKDASLNEKGTIHILLMKTPLGIENEFKLVKSQFLFKQMTPLWMEKEPFIFIYGDASLKVLWMEMVPVGLHIRILFFSVFLLLSAQPNSAKGPFL